MIKRLRMYADTSVIGGCFDNEFAEPSLALLDLVRHAGIVLVVSDLLLLELQRAPEKVRDLIAHLPAGATETWHMSPESHSLHEAYLKAKAVGRKHAVDAHHIALATVARADLLVSWNYKHIVHWDRIRLFNSVNLQEGYPSIEIRSPKEIV